MTKALFFDIDGTLVSFKDHKVPQSTVEAIKLAKQGGAKIIIATGRPKAFISGLECIEPYIDGYITNNGACVQIDGKIVASNPIARPDVGTIYRYAMDRSLPMIIMSNDDFAIVNNYDKVHSIFYGGLGIRVDRNIKPARQVLDEEVYQMTMFLTPEEEKESLMPMISHCNSGRWCAEFTDITDLGADKGKGLETMAAHLGIGVEDTMAFGDGGNDTPIIKRAGIGVAMGNAGSEVKRHAKYVTTSVDCNGIWNALKHFNVI